MNEYPIVETLRLDPLPTAMMVEMVVGDYLREPEKGIYFKGKAEPLMRQGQVYHQHKVVGGQKTKETFVVSFIEQLDKYQPVMDLDANVVVTPNQIPFLTYEPTLPVMGMQVVRAAVMDVINTYGSGHNEAIMRRDATQLYSEFIAPVVMQEQQEVAEHVIDHITGIVGELRAQVRNFCGDNRWIIHYFDERLSTFFIEKSIDWRIVEYHRLTRTKYGR